MIDILKDELRKMISKQADRLMEEDPEKYYEGTRDYGYYDNGVGMACYGKEKVYDEDQAYEDAKKLIAEDVANGSADYETAYTLFIDNNKITSALAKFIMEL